VVQKSLKSTQVIDCLQPKGQISWVFACWLAFAYEYSISPTRERTPGKNPGLIGVVVGAFADPDFPPPVRSVWEQSKHQWVEVSAAAQHFPKGRT